MLLLITQGKKEGIRGGDCDLPPYNSLSAIR